MLTSLLANATQSPPMRPSSSLSSSSSSSLSSATNLATATAAAAAAAASMFPLPNAVNVHLTSGVGGGGLGSLIMHHPDNYRQHLHHHHHHHHHQQQQQQQPQAHGQNNLHQPAAAHHLGPMATGSHQQQPPFPSHHLTPTPSPVKEANGGGDQRDRLSSPTPSSSSEMGSPKCSSNSNSSNTNNNTSNSHAASATNHSDLAGRATPSTPAAHQPAAHHHQHHPLHSAHPHLLLQTAAANYPMDIMERMQLSAAALQHQHHHHHLHSAHGNRGPPDDYSDARSSSVSSLQADSVHRADMDVDEGDVEDADEPDDDRFSSCSEDSDLSVGKEDESDAVRPPQLGRKIMPNPACHGDESSSSRPTSRNPAMSMAFVADKMSVDDLSNESTQKSASSLCQLGQAPALPIVRPSPTRLQEEFLRNSQLYAEELMKHQISFMAATKSLQLSAAAGANSTDPAAERKTGFRPHVRNSNTEKSGWSQPSAKLELPAIEGMQFRGIHSHLNAISKITSALGRDIVSLASPVENVNSRESSQSPPSSTSSISFNSNQQLLQHQAHHQQMINANLMHDSNLKFSIDNILKPGFGRRITDPLLKRNKPSKKLLAQQQRQQQKQQQLQSAEQLRSGTPIDLTPSATPASSASSSASSAFSASDAGHSEAVADVSAARSAASASSAPAVGSTSSGAEKVSSSSGATGSTATASTTSSSSASSPMVWPAWVYCTRYSDRPSSGRSPRTRRPKKPPSEKGSSSDEKRPRTAFSGPQLARLKHEFAENRYLTERRRQQLSGELGLNEAQIKIWFQNKRAKIKKSTGHKNPLALQLMAQGLYNHSTVPLTREEEELQELQAQGKSCS